MHHACMRGRGISQIGREKKEKEGAPVAVSFH